MFKNCIRERRDKLGFSQTQLACLLGMAGSTLSTIQLGKAKPWPEVRRYPVIALGMPEGELFPDRYREWQVQQ